VTAPYNKTGKEMSTFEEDVREIYKFYGVEELHTKGNMAKKSSK
jgi:hypothetical protein